MHTIQLQKYLEFHSEGSSIERYVLKKKVTLPFAPTVGLEVLQPDHFAYTCSRVVWRTGFSDYVVWDAKEEVNFDSLAADYPSIKDALQVYLDYGWETSEKIPEKEC